MFPQVVFKGMDVAQTADQCFIALSPQPPYDLRRYFTYSAKSAVKATSTYIGCNDRTRLDGAMLVGDANCFVLFLLKFPF